MACISTRKPTQVPMPQEERQLAQIIILLCYLFPSKYALVNIIYAYTLIVIGAFNIFDFHLFTSDFFESLNNCCANF